MVIGKEMVKGGRVNLLILILIGIGSCIDPYDPNIEENFTGPTIVVSGVLTTEDKRHTFTLTKSRAIDPAVDEYEFVEDAVIEIMDQNEECYSLNAGGDGQYFTDSTQLVVAEGNSYKIKITLASGKVYESDYQEVLAAVPVEPMRFAVENMLEEQDQFLSPERVLKIYVEENTSEEMFFRHRYQGTYAVLSPEQGSLICWAYEEDRSVVPSDIPPNRVCYLTEESLETINAYSTTDLKPEPGEREILQAYPDYRYLIGYSKLVIRERLTEGFYNYLQQVGAQREYGGGLFDPPPTEIVGNIVSTENQNDRLLGYFSAVSVSSRRIFIDNIITVNTTDPTCFYDPSANPPANIPRFTYCCDCLEYEGSTDIIPKFWNQTD